MMLWERTQRWKLEAVKDSRDYDRRKIGLDARGVRCFCVEKNSNIGQSKEWNGIP